MTDQKTTDQQFVSEQEKAFESRSAENTNIDVKLEQLPPQEMQELREAVIEEVESAANKELAAKVTPSRQASAPAVNIIKSLTYQKIEKILEEDLVDVYRNLNPEEQRQFKVKGEATVAKIEILLNSVKVKIKEIIELIRNWLILIPGVNKYFLEQEAKIKCDKILKLKGK